jgi:ankyrin repeat protein
MIAAISAREEDLASRMIDAGADVNLISLNKYPPLTYALQFQLPDVAVKLINAGADVRHKPEHGLTALHLAAKHGYVDVAKRLLEEGAKKNVEFNGWTPLEYAKKFKQPAIVSLLE